MGDIFATTPTQPEHRNSIYKSENDLEKFYSTMNTILRSQGKAKAPRNFSNLTASDAPHRGNVSDLIGSALHRKHIGPGYHYGAYPYFMRSQGPFKIYDHATAKGQQFVQNLTETNKQAHLRFLKDCEQLKERREHERRQFNWTKEKQDLMAEQNHLLRRQNNLDNLSYLADQITHEKQRKDKLQKLERLYYKPHFGPEETDELVELERGRILSQKRYVRDTLSDQMGLKWHLTNAQRSQEREGALQNLEECKNMFVAEERAKLAKEMHEK